MRDSRRRRGGGLAFASTLKLNEQGLDLFVNAVALEPFLIFFEEGGDKIC